MLVTGASLANEFTRCVLSGEPPVYRGNIPVFASLPLANGGNTWFLVAILVTVCLGCQRFVIVPLGLGSFAKTD